MRGFPPSPRALIHALTLALTRALTLALIPRAPTLLMWKRTRASLTWIASRCAAFVLLRTASDVSVLSRFVAPNRSRLPAPIKLLDAVARVAFSGLRPPARHATRSLVP